MAKSLFEILKDSNDSLISYGKDDEIVLKVDDKYMVHNEDGTIGEYTNPNKEWLISKLIDLHNLIKTSESTKYNVGDDTFIKYLLSEIDNNELFKPKIDDLNECNRLWKKYKS